MMNSIKYVVISLIMVWFIVACHHSILSPNDNPTCAACKLSCIERAKVCKKVCRNNARQCKIYSFHSAARGFKHYFNEQCIEGGIVARDLNSYRDPLQCRKTTCNCRGDFKICVQSCSGLIQKRLRVPLVC